MILDGIQSFNLMVMNKCKCLFLLLLLLPNAYFVIINLSSSKRTTNGSFDLTHSLAIWKFPRKRRTRSLYWDN
ncbi:hypothetical protein Syun_017358 [Stephania yunnanensis]|uniref:Uncharacterized protein n=1 Tax=Stephania yunnanensis TaxID=152371 RepID=A0AAP0P5R8_9MAGN